MKKPLVLILITGIILSTSLVIFIKSPYFLNLIEYIAGRGIGGSVEIDSLTFENRHRLTGTGLVIKGGNRIVFDLTVPRLELTFRLRDLLRKHIGGIILTGPDLSITILKKEAEKEISRLPFTLDKLSLTDGRINIHHEKSRSYQVSRVDLSLERDTRTGSTSLSAGALINDLNSEISIDAIIDMEKLSVENARVDVPVIDIEMLSGLPYFSFIKDSGLKGTASFKVDVTPPNTGTTDRTRINAALSVSGLSAYTEPLRADLGERLLNISLNGSQHRGNDSIDIDTLKVELPKIGPWTASGTLEKVSSGNPDINLTIKAAGADLKEIRAIVSGPSITWLNQIAVSGTAGADISVTGSLKAPEVKGVFTISGDNFKVRNILLDSFELSLPLHYREGALIIKDASAAVKNLSTISGRKEETGITARNFKLLIPRLEYKAPEIKSGAFQVTADKASVIGGKEAHTEKGIILKGFFTGNTEDRRLRFDSLSLNTDFVKKASGSVSVSMAEPALVEAALDYEDIDIEKITRAFSIGFIQNRELSVRGQGKAHVEFRITFPEKNSPRVYGTFEAAFKNAGFSSADETVVGERIKADLSCRFEFPVSLDSIDFSVSSEAAGFELLAGRYYGDFSDRAVHFLAEGRYTKADDKLKIVSSKLGIAGIGDMLIKGSVTTPGSAASVDADIKVPDLSGKESFDFFIRETFHEQYPFLSRIRISGQASVDVNVRGSFKKFKARGDLHVSGMEIVDVNSGSSVTGMNISLPFDISFPEAEPARTIDRFGSLRIREIKWPPLQLSGFEAFPAVSSNTLVFQKDIRLPLYGGSVTLKNVSYRNILSPQRGLWFAADADGIDLAQVGKALDIPGFSGSVKGSIPSASFIENLLVTEGEIILELFDGTIRVSGFAADNIFSPIASVKLDIGLDSIDLSELTSAFEFGHISGIMKGEMRALVIVNGQAESFKGHLETYSKKGIPQRISVEALKKISILGTGSAASVLDQGIYRLFREYRYEQIGFRASLRNDNLLLLGMGDENESQYLVKGGLLPPKVDVITYNKHISFKELVSRLKRISQIDRKDSGN